MQDTRGGYRPGAGRKPGSKNIVALKKAILEYTSPQELKNMVERAKKWTKTDRKMLQWYLEMVFGKPKTAEGEGPKSVTNIAYFLDKLEQEKLEGPQEPKPYFVGDIPNGYTTTNGFQTTGQIMETKTPIYDQGQESEQDTVQA